MRRPRFARAIGPFLIGLAPVAARMTGWRLVDTFKRASFLSMDRDSDWDLAMCLFVTVFATNEVSYVVETTTLILLSVLMDSSADSCVCTDDPIIVTASASSRVGFWR